MCRKPLYQTARFLSLALRHRPDKAGICLDNQGWVAIDSLLRGLSKSGHAISREELTQIVEENDKQRYAFNGDRTMIRASQGHSVKVALGYAPMTPPDLLYHGTVERFLASILQSGLKPKNRHHVHLSADRETATKVGSRRGEPVILTVQAKAMYLEGFEFFRSDNGVWLTASVPPRFIDHPQTLAEIR